jgi:TonB-dependent starch-binding outer membrane protein SusC
MKRSLFGTVVLLVLAMPCMAAAQGGVIVGRVTDAQTNQPVVNAVISLSGAALRAITNSAGEYRLAGVPAGSRTVSVSMIGYGAQSRTVTVEPEATVQADFQISHSAIELGGVVVTAAGQDQRRREVGNAVSVISVPEVNLAPINNLSHLIQGRAAGVSVLQSSGTTGTGARVRVRGSNSISLNNDPLIIIDGVRVQSSTSSEVGVLSLNGQQFSRWNDINPEEIESIEVIKGPAAAALYGTAAANGVIQITTRRGRSGATQFRFYSEVGSLQDITTYPTNTRMYGWVLDAEGNRAVSPTGVPVRTLGCTLDGRALGLCEPAGLISFNPIEENRSDVFRTGSRQTMGGSITGGGPGATYFLSAEVQNEAGIYSSNAMDQINLRGNVTAQVQENLTVSFRTGYVTSEVMAPFNDNAVAGVISGAILGCYAPPGWELPIGAGGVVPCVTDGWFGYPLSRRFAVDTRQRVERFMGSTNARWQPTGWLTINSVAGLDLLGRDDIRTVPANVFQPGEAGDWHRGIRAVQRAQIRNISWNTSAAALRSLTDDIVSTTTVGASFHRDALQRVDASGVGLLPGTGSLGGLADLFTINEANQDQRTLGIYGSQQIGYQDRLFLTGAVRGDQNSNFGQDLGFVYYPSISAAWVLGEEAWFPTGNLLSQFRVRAAYGQSGLMPPFRAAEQFFAPITATVLDASVPAVTLGGAGNVDLRPERSREYELGFDAGFLGDRLGLELTWYDKSSTDALVQRNLAPSVGLTAIQWVNLGRVTNQGLEALLNARLLDRNALRWDATLTFATTRNRLEELGEGVEPIVFGIGGASQRHEEGFPLGGYWAVPYTWADENNDGMIDRTEITYGIAAPTEENPDARDLSPQFLGSPFPTREISFSNSVTLFNNVRISALVDHKGGHKLLNQTAAFRCTWGVIGGTCPESYVEGSPLEHQARAIAVSGGGVGMGTNYGYVEDADFTKLREVSVSLTAPRDHTRRFGMDAVTLTLSGRNLATWTRYTGFDPEVNSGGQANFGTFDFLGQPPIRTFVARVDLSF